MFRSVSQRKKLRIHVCSVVFIIAFTFSLLSLIMQGFVSGSYVERFFKRHDLAYINIPVYTEKLKPYNLSEFISENLPVNWVHFKMLGFDERGFSDDEIAAILSDSEELVSIIASTVDRVGVYFRFGKTESIFTVEDLHSILDSISESARHSANYVVSAWDYDYAETFYETYSGYDTVPEIEKNTGISFSIISIFTSIWFTLLFAAIAFVCIVVIIITLKKAIDETDKLTKACNRFLIAMGVTLLTIYLLFTSAASLVDPILLTPYTQGGLSWLLGLGMICVMIGYACEVMRRHKRPIK